MSRRNLGKFSFAPARPGQDRLIEMNEDSVIVAVGYAGGAAVHLLVEAPPKESDIAGVVRSFRRFGLGDEIPPEYRYVGLVRIASDWCFIYERVKP